MGRAQRRTDAREGDWGGMSRIGSVRRFRQPKDAQADVGGGEGRKVLLVVLDQLLVLLERDAVLDLVVAAASWRGKTAGIRRGSATGALLVGKGRWVVVEGKRGEEKGGRTSEGQSRGRRGR